MPSDSLNAQQSGDAPTSVPKRVVPLRTAVVSGPPSVCQNRYPVVMDAPAGMFVISNEPVPGDPVPPRAAAKLSPTPSDVTFMPAPTKEFWLRIPLGTMRVDAARI